MHGIEEGLLDKGCAEASDLLYITLRFAYFLPNCVVTYILNGAVRSKSYCHSTLDYND